MSTINFDNLTEVVFDGTTCDTVIFNGTTIYTSELASYAYTNSRDNLLAGNTYSDTKTFPDSVASGSTNINVSGTAYRHYGNIHTYYYDNAVEYDNSIRFRVKLYNSATLLHTTAWSSWFEINVGNSPDSITYDIDFTTTVGSNITKAVLERDISASGNNQYCHIVCPSDTVTIG